MQGAQRPRIDPGDRRQTGLVNTAIVWLLILRVADNTACEYEWGHQRSARA